MNRSGEYVFFLVISCLGLIIGIGYNHVPIIAISCFLIGGCLVAIDRELKKLDAPARVGNTIFNTGTAERMVLERAKREYRYHTDPMYKITDQQKATFKRAFGK